jgi:hypothetical protein
MVVSWNKTDDGIWYGVSGDEHTSTRLYLIAERLPSSRGWDWALWQSGEPMILARGIAPSALQAAAAAELAAACWSEPGLGVPSQ